jgi:hypothetical protein
MVNSFKIRLSLSDDFIIGISHMSKGKYYFFYHNPMPFVEIIQECYQQPVVNVIIQEDNDNPILLGIIFVLNTPIFSSS